MLEDELLGICVFHRSPVFDDATSFRLILRLAVFEMMKEELRSVSAKATTRKDCLFLLC